MRDFLPFLAVLACPVGMGLMMWFMRTGKSGESSVREPPLDELRAEHRRVSADLEAAERRQRSA